MRDEKFGVEKIAAQHTASDEHVMTIMVVGKNAMLRDTLARQALARGHRVGVVVSKEKENTFQEEDGISCIVSENFLTADAARVSLTGYDAVIDATTPEFVSLERNVEKYAESLQAHKTRLLRWGKEADEKKIVMVDQAALFAAPGESSVARETHAINKIGFGRAYSLIWDDYLQQCREAGNVMRVHPAEIYGPGGWLQTKIVEPLKYTGHVPVIGEGGNRIPPLHVEDAAGAVLVTLLQGKSNEDYIFGGPAVVYHDFLEMVTGLMGLAFHLKKTSLWWEKIRRGIMASEHKIAGYAVDTSKVRQAFAWEPLYGNLQQGIAQALKSLGVLAWK